MAGQAPQTGEAAIGQNTGTPAPADASAKLSTEGLYGGSGIGGWTTRFADTTVEAAKNTPAGMLHQAEEWYHHPLDLGKTIFESAAIGAAVKIILPEAGPVAKVAGLAMGALFLGQAAPGIYQGYKEGLGATSYSGIQSAGVHLGDTVGGMIDNLVPGVIGYKIGTYGAGKWMASESFDHIAELKANAWKNFGDTDILKPKEIAGTDGAPARAEFQGSERAVPLDKSGKPLPEQEIDPNTPISIKLKLTRQNQGTFDRYVERIKAGTAEPMTRDEFMDKYSVDPKAVAAAKQFAAAHHLEVGEINEGARSFELKGTIAQMQNAFSTRLVNYINPDDGGSFRGRTGTYSVPVDMADHVQSVLGFDQRDIVKPQYIMAVDPTAAEKPNLLGPNAEEPASLVGDEAAKPKPTGHPKPKALQAPMTADDIARAYGANPDMYTNAGRNHVFNSFGGTVDDATIADAKSAGFNPKNFSVKNLSSSGEAPVADPKGANVENDLDFITQARNLRKATITMTANDNSTQGFVGAIDFVNHPGGSIEYDGSSTSWGGPDKQGWNAQGRAAMDESLKDGIALGKMHSFSSGDDGVTDRGSLKAQTDYPASSGNGTAVGGTEMLASRDPKTGKLSIKSETTWGTANPKDGAAGGGVSAVEDRPAYQQFITWVKGLVPGTKGRIVPDISADASPRTPVEVPTSLGMAGVGGTSFSNPLFYAMTRQLSEASGKDIGFINTQLYKWGQDPVVAAKVFNDITTGDNGMGKAGYHAGPGYDAATGWGSPNFQGMLAELKNPSTSAVRSALFGLKGSALRTAHTLVTNPGSLDWLPKGVNGTQTDNTK